MDRKKLKLRKERIQKIICIFMIMQTC